MRGGVIRLALVLLAAGAGPARGAQDLSVTVGQGWALVREVRPLVLRGGMQEWVLNDLPDTLDLSTLALRHPHVPIELTHWHRGGPDPGARHPALRISRDRVIWMPAFTGAAPEAEAARPVVCRLRAPPAGMQPIELRYVMAGMDWRAFYHLAVRGSATDEREPISIDLVGRVAVSNASQRAFQHASLGLVGRTGAGAETGAMPSGWLVVPPFSHLAHVWPEREAREDAHAVYRLSVRADLAALGTTEAVFAESRRAPARRLYAIDPARLSRAAGRALPMDRLVVLSNSTAAGLGVPLPEGDADVFLGGIGMRHWGRGRLPHTPAGGEIRIQLGAAEEVTVRQEHLRSDRLTTGNIEETFEITLANGLESTVQAEVIAEPEALRIWDVIRSSEPVQREGRRLIWRPTIPAGGEKKIAYQLRVQPAWDDPGVGASESEAEE